VMVTIPGPEWRVYLVNSGPGSFLPATVTTDNPDFAISGGTCADLAAVPAGQSCEVKIILTPRVDGPESATLTVAEAGFGAITMKSSLHGAGGEPALLSKQSAADLGTATVGVLGETLAPFDISNIYVGPTTVTTVTLGGANPKDFTVTRNGCTGEVAIGAECQIEVGFTPTDAGRRTATVNVSTSFGQYTSVLVSGTGDYNATLLGPPSAEAGSDIGIGGTGFPANTGLVVSWSDSRGRSILLNTDAHGSFLTYFSVARGQRAGTATLVAQVPNGPSASTTIEIVQSRRTSTRPPGVRG
jgi:hypothetical protein